VLVLALLVCVPGTGAIVLPHIGADVTDALGGAGRGEGRFPVVTVAGLASDGAGFAPLLDRLTRDGVPVLDLDGDRPGVQPFTFWPATDDEDVATVAVEQLAPRIRAAAERLGYDPEQQRVDVVAHSYGGLLARRLVEQEHWAAHVDDLVTVATPHHGTELGFRLATLGPGHEEWDGVGGDIRPGSATLRRLERREPEGEVYTTIGGDPVALRWLRFGGHGFDGTVPAESALLDGAAQHLFPFTHGRLLRAERVVDLVARTVALGGG
jgi:pimeloyl-ACP methyl ester carboxylesterase